MEHYAPRSPDLSALDTTSTDDIPPAAASNTFSPFDSHQNHTYEPPPLQQTPTDTHTRESFSLPAGAGSSFLPIATQAQNRQQQQQQQQQHHTSYQPPPEQRPDPQPQYGDPYSTAYNHIPHSYPSQQQPNLQNDPTMTNYTQSEHTRARPRRNPTKPTPTYQDDDSDAPSIEAESLPSPTSPAPPPQASYMPLTNISNNNDIPTLQQVPDPTSTLPSAAHDITIKTKFPLARIKRIVQADEDVGKVAQATPVAVAKALEQFMIQLAMSSAAAARSRGSRRVTAGDMKAAVGREGVFDFLEQVVSRIGDVGTAKGGKGKNESSPDVESGGGSDADVGEAKRGKKRGRGAAAAAAGGGAPRRRKKASDDD